MKKIIALILTAAIVAVFAFALTGCGSSGDYKLKSLKIGIVTKDIDGDDFILRLKADNKAEIVVNNDDIADILDLEDGKTSVGTWSEKDEKVVVTLQSGDNSGDITFKRDGDDRLVFSLAGIIELVLEK